MLHPFSEDAHQPLIGIKACVELGGEHVSQAPDSKESEKVFGTQRRSRENDKVTGLLEGSIRALDRGVWAIPRALRRESCVPSDEPPCCATPGLHGGNVRGAMLHEPHTLTREIT
jgi:hypothetical protein